MGARTRDGWLRGEETSRGRGRTPEGKGAMGGGSRKKKVSRNERIKILGGELEERRMGRRDLGGKGTFHPNTEEIRMAIWTGH